MDQLLEPELRLSAQAEIEDSGTGAIYVFEGQSQEWAALSASEQDPEVDEYIGSLDRLPALLIGLVRGPCRGVAARLAGRLDLVIGEIGSEIGPDVEVVCRIRFSEFGDWLDQIYASVQSWPCASIVTAMLLRRSPGTVAAGLVAESLSYSTLQAGAEFRRWLSERAPR